MVFKIKAMFWILYTVNTNLAKLFAYVLEKENETQLRPNHQIASSYIYNF